MGANVQDGPQPGPPMPKQQRRSLLHSEVMDLVVPPVRVGVWSGAVGVLAGVGGAIARDTSPFVGGLLNGTQWFALGSSYWFARTLAMKRGGEEQMRPVDKTIASAVAGSAAGAVVGFMRGPSKILPLMAIWGSLGAGGQMLANLGGDDKGNWFLSQLCKWSPLKKLTDEEYTDLMGEKIIRFEADIALIDDKIAELRAAEQQAKNQQVEQSAKPAK